MRKKRNAAAHERAIKGAACEPNKSDRKTRSIRVKEIAQATLLQTYCWQHNNSSVLD